MCNGTACIKFFFYLFNTFIALIGIGVIVKCLKLSNYEIRFFLLLLIAIGSSMVLISFIGWCSDFKNKNIKLTLTYSISLLYLLIVTCVLTFTIEDLFDASFAEKILRKHWTEKMPGESLTIKEIHGVVGNNNNSHFMSIPTSCYELEDSTKATFNIDECIRIRTREIMKFLRVVKNRSYIVIAVEIIALICASILTINFWHEQMRRSHSIRSIYT